jgi:prepilin-type N-terminal cleavage/methylation domain-containing protein
MNKRNNGFTLVELLAVITIVSIFMSFLFPLGRKMVFKSQLAKDIHNLRQIALSYLSCAQDTSVFRELNNASSFQKWAAVLASNGGINDPNCYVYSQDIQSVPKRIVGTNQDMLADFKKLQLSWVVIRGVPTNVPLETTPLLYSKGLNLETGEWEEVELEETEEFANGHQPTNAEIYENQLIIMEALADLYAGGVENG